jgi:hypothetical protein
MPKRSSTPPPDPVIAALEAVNQLTGASDPPKNPAAVALGRLGGLKGGRARAKKVSKKRLSAIGKKGATARWKKRGH